MNDPADRTDQWQRDHDPEPRDWHGQVPWQGESVPGGEAFARATEYVRAIRAGQSNTDAVLHCISATRHHAA
jgi:hypothetical protein